MKRMFRCTWLWFLSLVLLGACESKWVLTGSWQKRMGPQCDLRDIELELMRSGDRPDDQTRIVDNYLVRCKTDFLDLRTPRWKQILRMSSMSYQYDKLPYVKTIFIPEPGGYKLRARLALKPTHRPLPLLIVKCGLQCNLDDPPLSYAVTMFFDESPFHLLVLPSTSGREYQTENRIVTIGGFMEGQQLFRVAQHVQSPSFPYRARISSVHAAGFSLGGQALLYAALIGGYVRKPNGDPYIQSYLAACPVVDLHSSVNNLYRKSLLGTLARHSFWEQMQQLWSIIPILPQIITPGLNRRDPESITEILATASLDRYETATLEADLPFPLRNHHFRSKEDFWKANDFRNFASLLREHVFIWAADDDPIVSTQANSRELLKSQQGNPYLHAVFSENGTHCGFGAAYGWRTAGTILRSVALSHMSELTMGRRIRRERVNFSAPYEIPENHTIDAVKWQATQGIGYAKLTSAVYKNGCRNRFCAEKLDSFVPLNNFDLRTPSSPAEAQMLTRWMNANVWLLGPDGRNLDPDHPPEWAEWTEY